MASSCAGLKYVSVTTHINIILTHCSLKRNNGSNFVLGFGQSTDVNKHAFGHGLNRMMDRMIGIRLP